MKEITVILGIVFGILFSLGILMGLAMKTFGTHYGETLGGMAVTIVLGTIWGIPAAYYSGIKNDDEVVDRSTLLFCIWINRIFLGLVAVGIISVLIIG